MADSEYLEQQALVVALRARGIRFFAVPNEARRSFALATRMKKLGLIPGIPDIILIDRCPQDGRPVALEMKAENGRVSKAQAAVHEAMTDAGWIVIIAYGYQQAIKKLRMWGFDV